MPTYRRITASVVSTWAALWLSLPGAHGQPTAGPDARLTERAHRVASWLLDTPLDPRAFAAALAADWNVQPAERNAQLAGQIAQLEKVMALNGAERELVRLKLEGDLLAQARKEPTRPLHTFLLAAHAKTNPPLADGAPVLTRRVSDSFAQLWTFMFVEAVGGKHAALAAEVKDRAAAALASRWARMTPAQRERIAEAPLLLAAMRYRWPSYPEATRAAIRARWRTQFEPAIAKLMAHQTPANRAGAASPHDSRTAYEQARKLLADNQATVSLVSDMISMQAEATATIVRNLDSHHEYRWVYAPN